MSLTSLVKDLDDVLGIPSEAAFEYLDTGFPELNEILSGRIDGGLVFGRMYEMFGESSTGKTALATDWMIAAQRLGGVAGFSDWEKSFNQEMAAKLGLDTRRPHFMHFKPKTWEEGNTKAVKAVKLIREAKAIPETAPILWVFDSIASAVPKSQLEKEMDEYNMNDTTALSRVTSTTLKVMANYAEEFNAIFLYLNQMRLKPGVVYGDPRTTPGGKAMEYYASGRLALGRSKIMEGTGADKEFVGQKIAVQCVKSKFTKPFQETEMRLMFDEDDVLFFDMITSSIEALIRREKLKYSKPRVTWTDGKQYFVKALVEKIRAEGLAHELQALWA
jgi:protein RecA